MVARLTRKILDHERMDSAIAYFEACESGDKATADRLEFYNRRLSALIKYLDEDIPIPPIDTCTLPPSK